MELTTFQKQIVGHIIEGKVIDIISFAHLNIERVDPVVTKERLIKNNPSNHRVNQLNEGVIIEIQSSNEAFRQLKEYVGLSNLLKKANLILIEEKFDEFITESDVFHKFPIILYFNSSKSILDQPAEIHNLLWKYKTDYIIVLPELITFERNGYKTSDELRAEGEEKHRKTELKLTKSIAYISIVLSLILAFINFINYSNNRNVYIKEIPKTDSIHVIIKE